MSEQMLFSSLQNLSLWLCQECLVVLLVCRGGGSVKLATPRYSDVRLV